MSRALNDLTYPLKMLAFELIARCAEEQICLLIVDTLRTPQEQEENLRRGVSWTPRSKHLPGSDGKSRAIDVVPYEIYTLAKGGDKLQWDNNHPAWQKIGEIGEKLGLRWGGRWAQRDMGHFELP